MTTLGNINEPILVTCSFYNLNPQKPLEFQFPVAPESITCRGRESFIWNKKPYEELLVTLDDKKASLILPDSRSKLFDLHAYCRVVFKQTFHDVGLITQDSFKEEISFKIKNEPLLEKASIRINNGVQISGIATQTMHKVNSLFVNNPVGLDVQNPGNIPENNSGDIFCDVQIKDQEKVRVVPWTQYNGFSIPLPVMETGTSFFIDCPLLQLTTSDLVHDHFFQLTGMISHGFWGEIMGSIILDSNSTDGGSGHESSTDGGSGDESSGDESSTDESSTDESSTDGSPTGEDTTDPTDEDTTDDGYPHNITSDNKDYNLTGDNINSTISASMTVVIISTMASIIAILF